MARIFAYILAVAILGYGLSILAPQEQAIAQDSPSSEALTPTAQPSMLHIPIPGVAAWDLRDSFNDPRGAGRIHAAMDFMAPTGTPVFAVDAGSVVKLFNSKPGGLTLYQFNPSGELAYYYAHLDRYAAGLKEGDTVARGELIGYVGATGNADPSAPHLHFAIFQLGPQKQWWEGTPLNPYPRFQPPAPLQH